MHRAGGSKEKLHLQGAAVTELKQQPGLALGANSWPNRAACAVPDAHVGIEVATERAPCVRDGAHHVCVIEACRDVCFHWETVLHTRLIIVHDDLHTSTIPQMSEISLLVSQLSNAFTAPTHK